MEPWKRYYWQATPGAQAKICSLLASWWRLQEPPGRFVERSPIQGSTVWHELDNAGIRPVIQTYLTRDLRRTARSARTITEAMVDDLWLEIMGGAPPEATDLRVDEATAELAVRPEAAAQATNDDGQEQVNETHFATIRGPHPSSPCNNKETYCLVTPPSHPRVTRPCWQDNDGDRKLVGCLSLLPVVAFSPSSGTQPSLTISPNLLFCARRTQPAQASTAACGNDDVDGDGARTTAPRHGSQAPRSPVPQVNDDAGLDINLHRRKRHKLLPRNDSDQSATCDRTFVTFDSADDDNTALASVAVGTSAAPTESLQGQRCSNFDGTPLYDGDGGADPDMSSLMAAYVSDDPNKDLGRRGAEGDASWGENHEGVSTPTAGADAEAWSSAEADGAARAPEHSGDESTLWATIGGGGGGGTAAAAAAPEEGSVDFFFGNGGDASTAAEAAGRLGEDAGSRVGVPPPEPRCCGDPLCHKFGIGCCCCCSGRWI
jgi:hypothetical protein